MKKKLQLQSATNSAPNNFNIENSKGRPRLQWVGKKPLDKIEYYPAQEKEIYGDEGSKEFNKLFWGDNLQVLAHLLKEYRGKVDLIYIDPPFDSKAEYIKKVQVRGEKVEGDQRSLLEEKQYTDIWEKDEYLQFMYERLLLMRELLSDTGSIYLHCDWHRQAYLKILMDEVFGEENFRNEIIWCYEKPRPAENQFKRNHDSILFYSKTNNWKFNVQYVTRKGENKINKRKPKTRADGSIWEPGYAGKIAPDWWIDIPSFATAMTAKERTSFPTQKPEKIAERIIKASSNKGDLVADFFVGSGTTPAAAQKLCRRWIACDINLGAIQTTTKRLNQIIQEQQRRKDKNFKGLDAFKVLNVNDYDVFKNELEAKEIVRETYGVEPIKRSYFDGILDNNFVKVMPMNRVLNKLDIKTALKNVENKIDTFSIKKKSKSGEPVYEEGVLIIASGVELDVSDFLKKENKTGVKVEIRDILTDKKNLIFKKKPEAKIETKVKDKKLSVELKEFYSPILMRKLELENVKALKKEHQAKVVDFKQIIDSVAIDVDYNGKLFNAEIMDLPTKKELIKTKYEWEYPKKGKHTVAVKIVDVLGEEYFETFGINA